MIQVKIWSDLVCPFCYIGKRHWESALAQFEHRDQVKVTWKSFELDPKAPRDVGTDIYDLLATKYGRDRQWAIEMNQNVVRSAAQVGLKFDMDRLIPTNSYDAHRLIQLASQQGLQKQAIERFFSAYFVEGKHLGDHEVLMDLSKEIGLDAADTERVLDGDEFEKEVRSDEREAASLNISGVPFYLLNQKFAVSGAQPTEVFLKALNAAWNERA